MAGRKRTGTLVWTGKQWAGRIAGGQLTPLETADRDLARVRLAELVAGAAAPLPGAETFKEACLRLCAAAARDGMVTADERLSRLQRYTWPALGSLPVTAVIPGQISAVLSRAAATGLAQETIKHLQVDLSKVFAELVRDGILTQNPARAEVVRIPKVARDPRKRTLLTDDEFVTLITAATTPHHIAAMAVCSRCFGGLRPSDIYAWQWEDIDLEGWAYADAPRPKTEHHAEPTDAPRERIELPELVAATLRDWYNAAGTPTTGPVFPKRIQNLARDLRRALLAAGVTRPEVHTHTDRSLRADFYSFRRAFVTALAREKLNAQTSMRLAGHRSMTTHQRYNLPDVLAIPAGAVPTMPVRDAEAARDDGPDDFDLALENFSVDI